MNVENGQAFLGVPGDEPIFTVIVKGMVVWMASWHLAVGEVLDGSLVS